MIVFEPDLNGKLLIEAGAGTGKTWTIAGLYVRLIVEQRLTVDQVLVVTFTRAATAELRDRLRQRLVDTRAAMVSGEPQDEFERRLLERCPDRQQGERLLLRAIRSFDEACIFTIHGFCQRLLRDMALRTGYGFGFELTQDDSERIRLVVDDYWRRHFYQLSPAQSAILRINQLSADRLFNEVRQWVGRPWMDIHPLAESSAEALSSDPACFDELEELKNHLRAQWAEQGQAIRDLLIAAIGVSLNGNIYRLTTVATSLDQLEQYLQGEDALALPNKAPLFSQRKLDASVKKNQQAPVHPFFTQWQTLLDLHDAFKRAAIAACGRIRIEVLKQVRQELQRLKAKDNVLSYDDLLTQVHTALHGDDGASLAAQARERYRAALIDEFQDTDPLQYNIFDAIYPQKHDRLIFVGDPKQSIYRFRGADIHTYFRARRQAASQCALEQNFRSTPALIEAINTLFGSHPNPFCEPEIRYQPVTAGQGEAATRAAPERLGALRIWHHYQVDKPVAKMAGEALVVAVVADEIARLLDAAGAPGLLIDGQPLGGRDIAVLVRTHDQGAAIRQALLRRGIGCVMDLRDSVFDSREADELAVVLQALMPAAGAGQYRAALLTRLFGLTLDDIAALHQDHAAWDAWVERFYRWGLLWREKGFVVALRTLMNETGLWSRLLALPDGERCLTNLLQLIELLHRETTRRGFTPEWLLHWFNRQRSLHDANDEALLRLESDDNLVRIVTVHKSKGLQYGVVFCPFQWSDTPGSGSGRKGEPFSFHSPEPEHKAWLVMDCAERQSLKARDQQEAFSESLRLLYVALTRAKYHCTLVSGRFNNSHQSALAWLLHGADAATDDWVTASKQIADKSPDQFLQDLQALARRAGGSIELAPLPEPAGITLASARSVRLPGTPRRFTRELKEPKRVSSYSALTVGAHSEAPDYDREAPEQGTDGGFVRGAEAGVCLHWMFEHLDFTQPVSAQQSVIVEALRRHRFDTGLAEQTCRWLQDVIDTPLETDSDLSLSCIAATNRLNEMEFYFPVENLDRTALRRLLMQFYPSGPIRQAIGHLDLTRLNGYMKGFIDLVFEHQGRYYLVDYKSNYLGPALTDYHPQALQTAVAGAHYYLQYLIYLTALHRYLRLRLADYDYDRHISGAWYLFIRGMSAATGADYGIYHDRPAAELIESLDRLFSRSGET